MSVLDWEPEFGLVDGLKDSFEKDFGRGNFRKAADFSTDDMILEKIKGKTAVNAYGLSTWGQQYQYTSKQGR